MIGLLAVGGLIGIIILAVHAKNSLTGAAGSSLPGGVPAVTQATIQGAAVEGQQLGAEVNVQKQQNLQKWSAVAAVAAASTTAALSSIESLVALAGPVGIAVAAVIEAFALFRSTAHLTATLWVERVQNKFVSPPDKPKGAVNLIVDEKDASIKAGIATEQSVRHAYNAVASLWAQYQVEAATFSAQGKDQALVIRQASGTLTGFINDEVLGKMSGEIAQLAAASPIASGFASLFP